MMNPVVLESVDHALWALSRMLKGFVIRWTEVGTTNQINQPICRLTQRLFEVGDQVF